MGAKSALASVTVDAATVSALASLQPGTEISIPLPGSGPVSGRVNLVLREPGGIVRVGGQLIGARSGSFSLSGPGSVRAGRVLIPAEARAFLLSTGSDGSLRVQETPLAGVICFSLPREPQDPLAEIPADAQPQATPPLLSSRPSATAVLYLDFDGETVTDPDWNNGNTIVAAPSALTSSQITDVWSSVKEDFWPFSVDVTTDPTRYQNAPVGRRMRVIVTPTSGWYGSVGGVSYVGSFAEAGTNGFTSNTPTWVFNTTVNGVAEAISHELGHTLGLDHDGLTTNPAPVENNYYSGHGILSTSWAPIMGVGYGKSIVQWSKGEYANANNQQDDLAIIAGATNGFGYVPDDVGDTRTAAVSTGFTGATTNRTGIISSAGDADFYRLNLTGRVIQIAAEPATFSPNLDVLLELQDANGNVLASDNPSTALNASITQAVPTGEYYVKIQGIGRGNVLTNGYSSYGSIGHYNFSLTTPYAFTTLAGSADSAGHVDGVGRAARFNSPSCVAVDGAGNAYVGDGSNFIRKMTPGGVVTTVADFTPQVVRALAVDGAGNLFVALSNSVIQKITPTGARIELGGPADFLDPQGLAVDGSGALIVADTYHYTIRKISPGGVITTIAGMAFENSAVDGTGSAARFISPHGVAVDASGNIFVADRFNRTIRKVTAAGVVTTVAGQGGIIGSTDGPGSAALFSEPIGVALDGGGNLFITDLGNRTIRKMTPDGVVSTVGGLAGATGSTDGVGSSARFAGPSGIARDASGNLYITDGGNHTIRYGVPAVIASPSFAVPPAGRASVVGQMVALSAGARGYPFPSYQWYKNGSAIPGATDGGLVFASVQLSDAGSYVVVATNSEGSVSSTAVALSVNPPAGVVAVSAGRQHALVLRSDGSLEGMGDNSSSQLAGAVGSLKTRPVTLATDVVAMAAGDSFSLFVKQDGSLWAAGSNGGGQLGDGTQSDRTVFFWVSDGVAAVAAGRYDTFFIKSDGSLWGMGYNWNGELGDGSTGPRARPFAIATGVTAVAAGDTHMLFLKSDGTLWSTGSNNMGQLATGNFAFRTTPGQIRTDVTKISAAHNGSLFLQSDGTLWGAGYNARGQLADGSTTDRAVPVQMANGVSAFAAGYLHHLFVKSEGSLWAVGNNFEGQFGNGTPIDIQATPIQVATAVAAVATKEYQSYFVKADGSLWATGHNSFGQLGDGTLTDRTTAVQITSGAMQPPAIVTDVAATDGAFATEARVTWRPALGATRYEVWRGASNSPAAATLLAGNVSIPFYDDRSAVAGATYYYFVKAANPAGTSGFSVGDAGFRLSTAPGIATSPQSQAVNLGQNVTFSVVASGAGPFTYQWRKGTANIPGATSATFTINNVQAGDAGSYDVEVGNAAGSTLSSAATLTVIMPATITSQPAGTTIPWGQTTTLTVVGGGSTPLSYQWYQGSSPDTTAPIVGATNASYTTPALTATASYWVRVTNSAGTANSVTATVNVGPYTPTVSLTSDSGSAYSTAGGTAIIRARVIYSSQTPSGISVALALPAGWTFGSYSGPVAAAAPTAGATTLNWIFSTPPANELNFTFNATYPAGLTGDKAVTGSAIYGVPDVTVPFATLTFTPATPPSITTQPASRVTTSGVGTTFTVSATGTGPLAYQWRRNGTNLVNDSRISGATSATLGIAGSVPEDGAAYSVVVSNAVGTATSNDASLTVIDVRATHELTSSGYVAGGMVTISSTFFYSVEISSLSWTVLLPPGFKFVSGVNAGSPSDSPSPDAIDAISWVWSSMPPSGSTFTYTLSVPADATGAKELAALAEVTLAANSQTVQFVAKPDPLPILPARHSADTNGNDKLDVSELSRVIALYNTRFTTADGKIRTGAYAIATATTADGFAPDATRDPDVPMALSRYHSADTNHNGRIDVTELSRVITLYNTRFTTPDGKIRTGYYKLAPGGLPDGFAPDPARAP